jgi:RNA polymerase sigma-70 factor (ECF subfamily)
VIPDRQLVEEAAAGSADAFGELVRRYQSAIYNLARALTADPTEAEDLTQDAFIRAFRAIGRFRGDSSFKTWMHRIAVNVIHTHLAARARQRARYVDEPAENRGGLEANGPAAISEGEAGAVQRIVIERALAMLPPDLRTVVTLRDVQGLEYREIATLLDIPIGTVESRIFRARQRLRPLLAPLIGRQAGEDQHADMR